MVGDRPYMLDRKKVKRFHRLLFRWYKKYQRDLPWRRTRDPYKILVSEVMLQQTQVSRVIPKYVVWIDRYPTADRLASASTAEVLRLWSGLGYNRRAIYLKHAAEIIVNEWKGRWPQTISELTKLPGVGRYTAGAILSFAFGRDVPLADVNMARVIGRVFVGAEWIKLSEMQMLAVIAQTLPKNKSRIFPHAVMDLGAALLNDDPSLFQWQIEFPELFIADRKKSVKKESWQGSNRQIRGAILRHLHFKSATIHGLARTLSVAPDRISSLISVMVKEGLLAVEGDQIVLP